MASSIVHLAITTELARRVSFSDENRLKFGSVVVDAGVGGNETGNAHMKVHVLDGQKKTYDFDRFREMFGERMLSDDLYMGYYLHLVQDALYRHYVYDIHHWNPRIPGNVERLHRDYQIVNPYIINKYQLKNDLVVPADFDKEDLTTICSFDTARLLKDLEYFFTPTEDGDIYFFTREMTDEFISEALAYCEREVDKVRKGEKGIDMLDYAW